MFTQTNMLIIGAIWSILGIIFYVGYIKSYADRYLIADFIILILGGPLMWIFLVLAIVYSIGQTTAEAIEKQGRKIENQRRKKRKEAKEHLGI